MSIQIPRVRLIFKVLVLGRDIALQTGFLTQVSGNSISTQLFSTLGVSLGIARPDEDDEFAVALQLWTIPVDERVAGLSKSFTKGYSAAIAVIRPHDLYTAQEIFHELSLPFDSKAFILVVGDCEEVLKAHSEANCVLEESIQLLQINSATEVMTHISRSLAEKGKSSGPPHIYYLLDDALCPIFEPRMQESPGTVCSDDEIDKIREILIEQGFTVAGDACTIRMHEGLASVSLRTGSVKLQPEICRFCVLNCKRNANVCIIAVDSGWSSQGIGQKALLVAAKVFALADRRIPMHVETQLERASSCSKFELNPGFDESEVPIEIITSYQKRSTRNRPLLEVAEERVKNGKLPRWAYNVLKKRLLTLKDSEDIP